MEEMIPVDIGYRYTDGNKNEMVEYHVDRQTLDRAEWRKSNNSKR